jgi:hypothetical protein
MSWLPVDFVHPVRVPVPGAALHLRPITEADTAIDYPAVMGSRERLWEIFGPAWSCCVYIDPPERAGADGEVSWWVVDDLVGGDVERAFDALVPQWIAADWPFRRPRYLGRDIGWQEWLALPRPSETAAALPRRSVRKKDFKIFFPDGWRPPAADPPPAAW